MSDKIYDVSAEWAKRLYRRCQIPRDVCAFGQGPQQLLGDEASRRLDWIKPFTKVENVSFAPGNISIKWFEDGVLNAIIASTATSTSGAIRSPSSGKATIRPTQEDHLSRAA
jgi:hypothetical protein